MFNFFECANMSEGIVSLLIYKPHISVPLTETEVIFQGYTLTHHKNTWTIEETGDWGRYYGEPLTLTVEDDGEFLISKNGETETWEIIRKW